MPWLRVGDAAATNPIVSEVREHPAADDRSKVEVFGFVSLCAVTAAQHLTDYVVSRATAADITGSLERADTLLEMAVFAGYMEPVIEEVRGQKRQRWRIVEDPEFFHMRTEEEIAWERQRKRDNANQELVVPVRLRDGDACRYCGQVVKWRARRGRLAGTYDHRVPGKAAETVEDLVVSCGSCNSRRKNNPTAERDVPLLSVPSKPYFTAETIEWLEASDWVKKNEITIPEKPRVKVQPGTVPPGHESAAPVDQAAFEDSAASSDFEDSAADQASSDSLDSAASSDSSSAAPVAPAQPAAPHEGARPGGRDTPEPTGEPPGSPRPAGSSRFQQVLSERLPTVSDGPGRGGTGRDGAGRAGSPALSPGERKDKDRPQTKPPSPAQKTKGKRGRRGGGKKR